MPRIAELIDPATTVVVCHEMQRGVAGDLAPARSPTAEAVAASTLVETLGRLLDAARDAGVRVIHSGVAFRPDTAGTFTNTPGLADLTRAPDNLLIGSPGVDPMPELWRPGRDIVFHRFHGYTAFTGTELGPLLHSLATTTVVVTGVAVNRGVTNLTFEAVNHGLRVVLPRDAVIGYPAEYVEMMFEHTLGALAWLTTAGEVAAAWTAGGRSAVR